MSTRYAPFTLALLGLLALGCGSERRPSPAVDSGSADTGVVDGGTTDSAASPADSGTATDGAVSGSACLPSGVFGQCSTNPGCFCLLGATVYQFCTINCTMDSECGTVADTPGAVPGCFPINPGAPDKICALICTTPADCPCGLVCMPSGLAGIQLCAELQ